MKINSASELADTFICHFANIGHELAKTYLLLILFQEVIFSQQTRLSLLKVVGPMKSEKLEKLESKKTIGLDNLPSKMLKIAAGVLALPLVFLFYQSISLVFQLNGS